MNLTGLAGLLSLAALWVACTRTAPLAPKAVDLNRAGSDVLAAGDLETAEARFALALEYHPRFVEALTNLGLVEMQRGNLARARLQFERARRINPDLSQPHHALGVLAERERRADLAADHYRDALKVNPGFGPSRANLGRILFASGRYHEAREQFLRLVEVDPGQVAGRTGLAETLLQLGRDEDAYAVLDKAREDFGEVPTIVLLSARRAIRRGAFDEAEGALLPLTRERDDNARAAWGGSSARTCSLQATRSSPPKSSERGARRLGANFSACRISDLSGPTRAEMRGDEPGARQHSDLSTPLDRAPNAGRPPPQGPRGSMGHPRRAHLRRDAHGQHDRHHLGRRLAA